MAGVRNGQVVRLLVGNAAKTVISGAADASQRGSIDLRNRVGKIPVHLITKPSGRIQGEGCPVLSNRLDTLREKIWLLNLPLTTLRRKF